MKKLLIIGIYVVLSSVFYTTYSRMSAEELLTTLTLRQKIGQLFVIAAVSNENDLAGKSQRMRIGSPYCVDKKYVIHLIKEYGVGGVIFLQKSDPATQKAFTKELQTIASIPLLVVQDSEWGLSMRLDNDPQKVVRYPHNMTLGAITDKQLLYDFGYEIGRQCMAIGVHMNLAPVVDINNNVLNPIIHDRSFGDDPERVTNAARQVIAGMHDAGILVCIKHFPGHGDTQVDSHYDLPVIMHDRMRLNEVELVPFRQLAVSHVDAIMHGHLAVPALDITNTPSSLSYAIVTQLLQKEWQYEGLNITDGLGMGALSRYYAPGQLELAAFLAGNDILLCPVDVPGAIDYIEDAIIAGQISEGDLDRRVLKILRAKEWAYERSRETAYVFDNDDQYLVRPAAYDLQQKLYQAAITVVSQHHSIELTSDMMSKSSMVQVGVLPGALLQQKSIDYGYRFLQCSAELNDQEYDHCIQLVVNTDTVILVIGEMHKCITRNFGVSSNTIALLQQLRAMNKKVIAVIFGTPYSLTLFNDADMVIVAYENISVVQQAVLNVLSGILPATGRLPIVI